MRALVVLTHPPLVEGGAAGRCGIALIRGLKANGVDVTAVAANFGMHELPPVPLDLGVEVVGVSSEHTWSVRAARYVHPRTGLARGALAARVQTLAEHADVVYLDELSAAALESGLTPPAVVHLHCLARLDRGFGAPWTTAGRDGLERLRAERRVTRQAGHLVANSQEMASALVAGGAGDVVTMPLALDPGAYRTGMAGRAPVAGIIGLAAWPPTANAVRRLLTRVWPLVLQRRPDARLKLAGHGMTRTSFPGLPDLDGVEWVGRVESASAFLRSLGLLIYPLGRGSGTKVKVLEAMALGLPVVTTSPGAEGVGANRGVTVVDTDAGLAGATAGLLADPGERRERGAAGRAEFERRHTPAPATAPLLELFERVARSP